MEPVGVVLGLYGMNALGVTRALGEEGIRVVGFHAGNSFPHAAYSKYMGQGCITESSEELAATMQRFGDTLDDRVMVFPTGDEWIAFCDTYRERLKAFILPEAIGYTINELLSKEGTLKLGAEAGFLVPESGLLSTTPHITGAVMLKPLDSVNSSKRGFRFCADNSTYHQTRDSLLTARDMLVQEYIDGGPDTLFEVHTYLGSNGPVIAGMFQRTHAATDNRFCHGMYGIALLGRSIWLDELVEPSLRLTELLGFTGALDINLKRAPDGSQYYLETNIRTSGNLHLDTVSGRNLPAFIVRDKRGETYEFGPYHEGTIWLGDQGIYRTLAARGSIPIRDIVASLMKKKAVAIFNRKDPRPFFEAVRQKAL